MAMITSYTSNPNTLSSALLASNSGIEVLGNTTLRASSNDAVSLYSGFQSSLGIGDGLLLTSGYAPGLQNTVGWDGQDNSGVSGFSNGDADIDAVVNTVFQTQSYDATTLEFDFKATDPNATSISFDLVFGSEEYPEWVDAFVDCAVVIVNGVNYALFNHDPNAPLSVISPNLAAGYFQDNAGGQLLIQYDGVSQVLKIVAPIKGNGATNRIKIGIADTGDHILDSGVFIANMSAGNIPGSGVVSTPGGCSVGDDNVTGSLKNEYFDLQAGNDTVYAGAGDDIVVGGAGNDAIYGGSGADEMKGDAGDDWLDGGADIDTADFSGDLSDFTVSYNGATTQLSSSAEGVDTLVNVEFVKFKSGLYALNGGALTLVDTSTPPLGNAPGLAAISGIGSVGSVLTAIVSDPEGINGAVAYQWYADGMAIAGSTSNTCTVTAAEVGAVMSFTASYTDGKSKSEFLTSAGKTIANTNDGDFAIQLIQLSAPLGATVMNPLTTLIYDLVQLGVTPNEATVMVKAVLGIDPSVDLRTYDSWAALSANGSDFTALAVEIVSVQVAVITSAGGDQSGMALAQLIATAYQSGQTIDLSNLDFITNFIGSNDPSGLAINEIQDRNSNLKEASSIDAIEAEWADFQTGLAVVMSGSVGDLSVHINQGPSGMATAQLTTQQETGLVISLADLLAGFSDLDGGTLGVAGLSWDQGGAMTANADGSWTFVPDAGFSGPVELTYSVEDGQGALVSATIMLVVTANEILPPVDHEATGVLNLAGIAEEGTNLVASLSASDIDGAITVGYQWQEAIDSVWTDMADQSFDTLVIPDDQSYVGKQVRAVATSTDALGGQTVFEGMSQVIANVNDAHTGTVSISGTAQQGQILTASNNLADPDGLGTIAYQWFASGVNIVGATGSNLALTADQVGKTMTVTASYTDSYGTFEAETSAATAAVSAPAALNLVGTAGADTLTGGAGNDNLSGLAGIDKLYGQSGNDVLNGGAGTDVLDGGDGSDLYLVGLSTDHGAAEFKDSGLAGVDEVRFAATNSSTLTLYSGDTGIERVVIGTGSAAAANATGTTALNVNAAAVGNALVIVGNAGINTLTGGSLNDVLDGGAGADKLVGGGGGDTLMGGAGKDVLSGGAGSDVFVFNTAANASTNLDTITDFVHLTDKLQFSTTVFSGLGPTWTPEQFWTAAGATSAHDATDRLVYNATTGALYYDADGSGGVAAIQVALVGTSKSHPTMDWTDIQIMG